MPPKSTKPTKGAKPATAKEHNLTVPFFRLPAELRNAIYDLIVIYSSPIDTIVITSSGIVLPHANLENVVAQPALTSTCSAIRQVVLPMFYSSNDFVIGPVSRRSFSSVLHANTVTHWLRTIGTQNRDLMNTALVHEIEVPYKKIRGW